MKRKLFDKTLDFEVNVIGYKEKGESIVFFLKADGKVIYSGLVDCYVDSAENAVLTLLEEENVHKFDFVCWTHPHDDHTLGMDKFLEEFCDEKTLFWMPPFISKDVESCSLAAQDIYKRLFEVLESKKRSKMNIREASDAKILEKFECCGNFSINPYIFEIRSFAPDSSLLASLKVRERFDMGNIYSVGLIINIGHFYIVLAGDVENRTIKMISDFNFDIEGRIDYLKIPHHSSGTADFLIDKFKELDIEPPEVATTTVYRIHKLPDKQVLKKYFSWGGNTKIYSTGNIEDAEYDKESIGMITTTVDILEKTENSMKTNWSGNAVCVTM